jgi:hypothetical protein
LMSYWWLSRKITFQQAALPYLYRLANFPNNIPDELGSNALGTPEEKQTILSNHVRELLGPAMPMAKAEATAFINDKLLAPTLPESWLGYSLLRAGFSRDCVKRLGFRFPKCEPAHLILAGMPNAGKSSLAVGIGTEFVFKLGLARYVTLATLLDVALERDAAEKAKAFAVKKAMEGKTGIIDYEESPAAELQAQEADAMTKGKPEPPRAIRAVEEFNDGRVIWKWSEVQMLIVDDVDDVARVTHGPESLTSDGKEMYNQTVAAILKSRFGSVIQDLKKIPRTIWICNQLIAKEAVKGYLEQILGFENVGVIYLEDTIEEAQRKKAEKHKGIK